MNQKNFLSPHAEKNPTKETQYDFRERSASRTSSDSIANNPESPAHGLIIQAKRDGRFVSPRIQLLLDQLGNRFLQELSWTGLDMVSQLNYISSCHL